ncbi:MAG: hypothetical protein MUC77_11455 [Chromatiaceae bacterium]|nr:hypothetical protein [Chromatiaceae bacterium]
MELPFTHKPGRRERHLRRRHENPLFAWPPEEVAPEVLLEAQRLDHEEMEAFRASFRALVQRAVDLPPDAGSETVLGLKEELERHYEQACGLPEDHRWERESIAKLIGVIMKVIRRSAGPDPLARQELDDEESARAIHFGLLQQPLVVDILHPETPIASEELVPSLLSAGPDEVEAALDLFDPGQVALLVSQASELLARLESHSVDMTAARGRLAQMQARLLPPGPARTIN